MVTMRKMQVQAHFRIHANIMLQRCGVAHVLFVSLQQFELSKSWKNHWISILTMFWQQAMDNGSKRWNLLKLLEINHLDTQKTKKNVKDCPQRKTCKNGQNHAIFKATLDLIFEISRLGHETLKSINKDLESARQDFFLNKTFHPRIKTMLETK